MNIVDYNNEDLQKYKYLGENIYGPYNITDWLNYADKNKKIIKEEFRTYSTIIKKYPRIHTIQVNVEKYNKNNQTIISNIKYTITQKIKQNVENRSQLSKFGLGLKNSNMITSVGDDIKMIDPTIKLNTPPQPEPNTTILKNNVGLFKPKQFEYRAKKTSYQPPNISKNTHSIVIKNLPNDINIIHMKKQLIELFNGVLKNETISKINILANSNGEAKGIAFIDLYNEKSVEEILNSDVKFKIGYNILSVEKKLNR